LKPEPSPDPRSLAYQPVEDAGSREHVGNDAAAAGRLIRTLRVIIA
jgi:hypothetical protein